MNFRFHLPDNKGGIYVASNDINPLMEIMTKRWAGSVVTNTGKILFDIATDRKTKTVVTKKVARLELNLAWERYLAK